jgi:hypothetical protein
LYSLSVNIETNLLSIFSSWLDNFLPNNNEKCYMNFSQKFLASKHALTYVCILHKLCSMNTQNMDGNMWPGTTMTCLTFIFKKPIGYSLYWKRNSNNSCFDHYLCRVNLKHDRLFVSLSRIIILLCGLPLFKT